MNLLEKTDPQIAAAIDAERRRQHSTLELIASENHVSTPVLQASGTMLTDKYAEGYPRRRWYCGCENMDVIEQIAIDRAKQLFGAEHANVQPHSGTSANLAVYLTAIKPGQKIMGMRLDQGGHLSHGLEINLSGISYNAVHYGLRQDTELLDMDEIRAQALKERPQILVVGASAYSRTIDFKAFSDIAKEINCLLLCDIAHIAGLVAGGIHPDPVPVSDFVTTTTHKTLRGPRGGVILCKSKWAKGLDTAIFPGLQGGPLMHVVAAKAVAFAEALRPEFKQYVLSIVNNAKALAEGLMEHGWRIVSGGTDNHLMLVDLRKKTPDLTGHVAAKRLAEAGIVSNKNKIPFDPRSAMDSSGIRLGTPAVTTRGMGPEQMKRIAGWIDTVLMGDGNAAIAQKVRNQVEELCNQFPIPNSNH
ncbi:MAG: serine hydroxymethyltransferase [Planctomycetes bacterium]|jgi:glycine hydroxymethyltransferase|nr:serine hydroxymethyltransferase [Planctomycetota bacterium]